jgi:hypothetical protein
MAKPTKNCSALNCRKRGERRRIFVGTYCQFRCYCDFHFEELERLRRSQAKDWGRARGRGFDARLYYASKRGFHAY